MSDANEHYINVFAGNGNFLYKFGNKGEENGEFINLRHLSVNKAGHLMVYETSNIRVLVFELSGKFVTKFGSKGNKEGEFNTVISTAVLSNDRIPVVVSDYLTHRIHIFK